MEFSGRNFIFGKREISEEFVQEPRVFALSRCWYLK